MKRMLALFAGFAVLGLNAGNAENANLLPNGDFEELMQDSSRPVRWGYRQTGSVSHSIDSKEKASGNNSVLFTFPKEAPGEEGYVVFRDDKMNAFQDGKKYSFSMQYKASEFKGGVAIILICYKGDAILSRTNSPAEKVESDCDWKKLELKNVEIPKGTDKVTLSCFAKNKTTDGGNVWIDNATAEEVK